MIYNKPFQEGVGVLCFKLMKNKFYYFFLCVFFCFCCSSFFFLKRVKLSWEAWLVFFLFSS